MKISIDLSCKYDSIRMTWAFISAMIGCIGLVLALLCKETKLIFPGFIPLVLGTWSVSLYVAKSRYLLVNSNDIRQHPEKHFQNIIILFKLSEWFATGSFAGVLFMLGCWIYISL